MANQKNNGVRFLFSEGEVRDLMVAKSKELTSRLHKLQELPLEHRQSHVERDLINRVHKLEFMAMHINLDATDLSFDDLHALGLLQASR